MTEECTSFYKRGQFPDGQFSSKKGVDAFFIISRHTCKARNKNSDVGVSSDMQTKDIFFTYNSAFHSGDRRVRPELVFLPLKKKPKRA